LKFICLLTSGDLEILYMKSKKIIYLEKILRYFASKALRKFKPRVVGITGSVGKTSTKEAIYTVLVSKFRVRKNEKNYNNEIGLPLTVLGLESGGGSLGKWALVLLRALGVIFLTSRKKYPEILVLEMGADRPGDIKYLVDFIRPEVGVVTTVGISHLEFFKEKKQIAREKSFLVRCLGKDGLAVLNCDDEEVKKMAESAKAKKIFYGFSEEAEVGASDVFFGYEKTKDHFGEDITKIRGISFKLSYEGTTMPVRLVHSVGNPQIYCTLAATAVGIHFEMNILEIVSALKDFQSPVGRLNLIDGIKNTVIIEDSYNAAPQSTLAALEVLEKIQARRKLAVLGNMLELGADTETGHREVGRKVAAVAQILFAVGDMAKFIADEARKQGMSSENIFEFENSDEARLEVQKSLQEGDVILVKGSQGARMEKISEEIMRYPDQAENLLPRQTSEWKGN
jgi:UDP-N-acetylmuramoyl-tripeptide--D-alanyl-D-alanine ligase